MHLLRYVQNSARLAQVLPQCTCVIPLVVQVVPSNIVANLFSARIRLQKGLNVVNVEVRGNYTSQPLRRSNYMQQPSPHLGNNLRLGFRV